MCRGGCFELKGKVAGGNEAAHALHVALLL